MYHGCRLPRKETATLHIPVHRRFAQRAHTQRFQFFAGSGGTDVPQAVAIDEGALDPSAATEKPAPAAEAPPPPQPEQRTLGGFFRRLFKRGS